MAEKDPTQGIVDAETFIFWIVGYTSNILQQVNKTRSHNIELIRERYPNFLKGVEPPNRPSVHLKDCPWLEVPESLRQVMLSVYDAAQLEKENTLDVSIDSMIVSFELRSQSIKSKIYSYGENYTGIGPALILYDAPERNRKKGDWVLQKTPNAIHSQSLNLFKQQFEMDPGSLGEEAERLQATIDSHTFVRPAILEELHDVARFLEKSKDRAVVYS